MFEKKRPSHRIGNAIEEPLPAPIKTEWGCRHVTAAITTA